MESQEEIKDMAQVLLQDPPVIVGGGGSAYVWIKRGATLLTAEEVEDLDEDVPKPGAPENFIVYRVEPDLTLAVVYKGDNKPPKSHTGMHPKYHSTAFQ
jgi:hypothetical protein